jgi:HAD superfamily hydrolase (TIGR01509 family)
MIEAILWDNDGVLVNTERLYLRATQEILAKVGVDLTRDMYIEFFLKQGRGAWHLAEEKGVPAAEVSRLREERNKLYTEFLHDGPLVIDGAEETLAQLHGRFTMGIVTSSRRDHFETIHQKTSLLQYVDFVLTGDDYVRFKPDPEPYLMGVEKTGLGKEACLVIEDSGRGLIAARRAGLACWVIPTDLTRDSDFSAADSVLTDITEVASQLLKNQQRRRQG